LPIICAAAVSIRLILYSTLNANGGGRRYHDTVGRTTFFSKFETRFGFVPAREGERQRKGEKKTTEKEKTISFVINAKQNITEVLFCLAS